MKKNFVKETREIVKHELEKLGMSQQLEQLNNMSDEEFAYRFNKTIKEVHN